MGTEVASQVLESGLRTLFVLGLPMIVAVAAAGGLFAVIQAATTVRDDSIAYAVRVIALVAVITLLFPTIRDAFIDLAVLAFSGSA